MRLLATVSRRHLLRHPWQIALATLGIALGVAVVVAIDLANGSATRAFELSSLAVSGRTTDSVLGGPSGIPDGAYRALVVEHGLFPAAPVVEGVVDVELPDGRTRTLRLLGLDPLSEAPFRTWFDAGAGASRGRAGGASTLAALMVEPGALVASDDTARTLGVTAGQPLRLVVAGVRKDARLAGTLEPRDALSRRALDDLLVADIATAQELLGMPGRLSRIDLIAPAGDAAWRDRVAALLPPGMELVPASARASSLAGMTAAFRLNLTALSLLALVCGTFLIYNTVTFSVVQRRPLIGLLRAVGVTRREIFRLVLGEAARVGVLGTALGIVLGIGLGQGLVRLVTRTINDLYFVIAVRGASIEPFTLAKGIVLGLGATLLAALPPAFEATRAAPRATLARSELEDRARRAAPRAALAGVLLLALGGILERLPGNSLPVAFAGLFAIVIGCALLAPLATVITAKLAAPLLGRTTGVLGTMAARSVQAALSRTAVAIAALMIAVSVAVGMGVMIRSFRGTVVNWLDATLQADVYVSSLDFARGRTDAPLPPELVQRLRRTPGAGGSSAIRGVELDSAQGSWRLQAIELEPRGRRAFTFKDGNAGEAWAAFAGGDAVLVSEPFAFRHGVGRGSTLTLRTALGPHAFRVAGVFYSYSSDQGIVMIDRAAYRRWWRDDAVSGVSLWAAPGVDAAQLAERARALARGGPAISIQTNRALRDASLEVFDRTFTITAVLRLVVAVVAFIGVLTALLALSLERAREFAVLRANGLTPAEVWQSITTETALMGLAAGVLAVPVGLLQAALMIFVINRRSFGWTLQMQVEPAVVAEAIGLALLASLLAGLYPAWKISRVPPALGLREE